jgi:hypothetical protein
MTSLLLLLLLFFLLLSGKFVSPQPNYVNAPLPTRIDALSPLADQSPIPTQLILDTGSPIIPTITRNRTSTPPCTYENYPSSATIVDVTEVLTMAPRPTLVASGSCGRRLRVGAMVGFVLMVVFVVAE